MALALLWQRCREVPLMPRGLKKDVPKRIKDRPVWVEEMIAALSRYPFLMKDRHLSEFAGISASTLRKARCEGLIRGAGDFPPPVKIGGRIFYRKPDVIEWLVSLKPQDIES